MESPGRCEAARGIFLLSNDNFRHFLASLLGKNNGFQPQQVKWSFVTEENQAKMSVRLQKMRSFSVTIEGLGDCD